MKTNRLFAVVRRDGLLPGAALGGRVRASESTWRRWVAAGWVLYRGSEPVLSFAGWRAS